MLSREDIESAQEPFGFRASNNLTRGHCLTLSRVTVYPLSTLANRDGVLKLVKVWLTIRGLVILFVTHWTGDAADTTSSCQFEELQGKMPRDRPRRTRT